MQVWGEKNPTLGKNYDYMGSFDNTSESYSGLILTVYKKSDNTKILTLYSGSQEGSFWSFSVPVKTPKFQAGVEYVLEIKKGSEIAVFEITPVEQKTATTKVPKTSRENPTVGLIGTLEGRMENRWLIGIEVCAGKNRITSPVIEISSDIDRIRTTLNNVINAGSCSSIDLFEVVAKDPRTINIDLVYPISSQSAIQIPLWIKTNAKWWADGQIEDSDFVQGIQYLITQEIIKIPETKAGSGTSQEIPAWIRNNAKWWADGHISNDDFVAGIQYLISNGIMKI